MLVEVTALNNDKNKLINRPEECIDYIRSNAGKMLHRTILLSNILLPPVLENTSRNQHIPCEILGPLNRFDGLDTHRIKRVDIQMLRELESDVFEDLD